MIRPLGSHHPNTPPPPTEEADYLPARMINEFVYCPRLFYLEHVEGLFAENRFTIEGSNQHKRVDAKTDPLISPNDTTADKNLADTVAKTAACRAKSRKKSTVQPPSLFDQLEPATSERRDDDDAVPNTLATGPSTENLLKADGDEAKQSPEKPIHARSVTLASDRLGVVAKLDLVEATGAIATPVDYKRGSPRIGPDGSMTAWDPERVQLCLQALVLRESGFQCDEAIVYFQTTRQRVKVPITDDLIALTEQAVHSARSVAQQSVPPLPLVNSPKCPHCSLSPICLPDETNRCRQLSKRMMPSTGQVRLPVSPRDDLKPLYLNRQGIFVGKTSETLQIKEQGKLLEEVRLREINQVNLFGNIQLSTQAVQTLLEMDVPLVMFSQRGYFQGMLQGTGLKNIVLRREQFRMADDPQRCLDVAKQIVQGKIINQRVLLMRNHISPENQQLKDLKRQAALAAKADRLSTLLGIEGNAARIYFSQFAGMIKPGDGANDSNDALGDPPRFNFDFRGRNRRPPRDPVNAMLSLVYTLLAKDLAIIAAAIGFDPYLGFYHQVRPGRPALALDMMEPFRPILADSVVISAINNRMVSPEHFIDAGNGVTMTESGRRAIFHAYELRMDQLVTHPLFDYRVSYRRLLDIQTRLLGKLVRGEIDRYPVFTTR